MKANPVIAIHGGAGTPDRTLLTPEREVLYLQALQEALRIGWDVLQRGGSADDAVVEAVKSLEDCPLFNAGRGSVFNHEGIHEMDACFASGKGRLTGAVAGVRNVRHPIELARLVALRTPHVLLAGTGAQKFAEESGVELMPEEWFYDEYRYRQWQEARSQQEIWLDHGEKKWGTVGAVARDRFGHLAAATSTGGMTNKKYGRVGDTPIFGAGTFADDALCAISCTGHGEFFIRYCVAHEVAAQIRWAGRSLAQAAWNAIHGPLCLDGGEGGLIAVGPSGDPVLTFNCAGMFRAWITENGQMHAAIF
ncbi:MAG: isoaspartyl peptidase/L-asparaginase [Flavobacteriales bacterium]|nr:isoaspartyl peptidase/L-asparaginase [Flavobacteriales bacterium]MCX7769324.1 isoaspartyl peptidase/L-asparaginase [Flavobacteriales bacterium]MDW8410731.1 isoaspartyl peptidase/L-asparaginase [Flavobacteriales bacterium]